MTLARCSICALFIRVFFTKPFSKRGHADTAHFYGTLMKYVDSLLTPTLSILGTLFQCRPVSLRRRLCGISLRTFRIQLEQINHKWKKCGDSTDLYVAIAAWNIINDVLIWSLPILVVWRFQLPHTHKIVLSAVFALGLFDVAAGAFRIVTILGVKFHSDVT